MRASSHLAIGLDERGWSTPTTLRAEAPLLMRVTDQNAGGLTVHMIGGAAGPLGGDRLDLAISVAEQTRTRLRSVAASLAQPGREPTSISNVDVHVADDAVLDWWPQPLLSIARSDHVMRTTIHLEPRSSIRWVDEVVLGRAGETGGRLTVDQRVTVGASPIVCHRAVFDPCHVSSGRHGAATAIVTALVVGPDVFDPASIVSPSLKAARFAISPTATSWIGLGTDIDEVRATLVGTLDLGRCFVSDG